MSVKIFVGKEFTEPYETQAIKELAFELRKVKSKEFYIFANLWPSRHTGRKREQAQIDLLIVSSDRIVIVELKKVNGAVIGNDQEGNEWITPDRGSAFPGSENPVQQVIRAYRTFRGSLFQNRNKILGKHRGSAFKSENDFDDIKKFIALYPTMYEGSEISVSTDSPQLLPNYGDVVGFDQLIPLLIDRSWKCFNFPFRFDEQEIRNFANIYNCTEVEPSTLEHKESSYSNSKTTPAKKKLRMNFAILLALVCLIGLASILVLGILVPNRVHSCNMVQHIEISEASQRVDQVEVVLFEVSDVWSRSNSNSIFLGRQDPIFTVQISVLDGNATAVESEFEQYRNKHLLVEGPISLSDSGNPIIRLSYNQAKSGAIIACTP